MCSGDMAELSVLITSLILERPLCLDCIARKANASRNDVAGSFIHIKSVLKLRRYAKERCRACGIEDSVFDLERPPDHGSDGSAALRRSDRSSPEAAH